MLNVLLALFWYLLNHDVSFKITNRLKANNDNLKFNSDFKIQITVERSPKEY
jgi:hypothetical protein